jgi:RecJ-like exonuclease
MLNHLPDIMKDIAEDSESRDVPCPRCDGVGHVMRENGAAPCPQCDGAGKVSVPGDAHARRLIFEILGLIGPRRGGPA